MRRKVITSKQLTALDDELFGYKDVDRAIRIRREELSSSNSSDTNIGGSKSGHISRVPETLTVRFASDIRLKNLELYKETVEKLYENLTEEQREIFNLRWIQADYSWKDIAQLIHVSIPTIYRKRDRILEKYDDLKGN
ncbi:MULTISPECIES: transcriptional regulator [unclassified Streptococcus]|uniref:transcriptional regulator n=1 Tax=unclassified Streptococcus TaxID=2608887 RepID=UPI00211B31A8|nr:MULTISPECIES: transcriptional regulator [unclassified Streptococcus]MCQ9211832.1 transcriptional regulator [Streptococcus sp. B01]MCQ9212862.1 transcriptional regulator [Streptococcus sp. B01]MCQ9212952.1 transcriptional regulator [Streptococcus sp. O1]MCQ9215029.1 transcriptional regulator [Streptococcus sp. O1]